MQHVTPVLLLYGKYALVFLFISSLQFPLHHYLSAGSSPFDHFNSWLVLCRPCCVRKCSVTPELFLLHSLFSLAYRIPCALVPYPPIPACGSARLAVLLSTDLTPRPLCRRRLVYPSVQYQFFPFAGLPVLQLTVCSNLRPLPSIQPIVRPHHRPTEAF